MFFKSTSIASMKVEMTIAPTSVATVSTLRPARASIGIRALLTSSSNPPPMTSPAL